MEIIYLLYILSKIRFLFFLIQSLFLSIWARTYIILIVIIVIISIKLRVKFQLKNLKLFKEILVVNDLSLSQVARSMIDISTINS